MQQLEVSFAVRPI